MKIVLPLAIITLMTSCTKNYQQNISENTQVNSSERESCKCGQTAFNMTKRQPSDEMYAQSKSKRPNEHTPAMVPNATILLSFYGYRVANTPWNTNGDVNCAPANLTTTEIDYIIRRVKEDFAPFNVMVTTDEMTYHQTNPKKRMRVIITESWEWHGIAGGVAFYDSFTWGNNTPCFVFSSLMGYNEKFIAEGVSHEVGHTLGLKHQADYSNTCTLVSEFNTGKGDGQTGWAPIMGIGYYKNVTTWHKGPTLGCDAVQDDVSTIASIVGLKQDENVEMDRAVEVQSAVDGVMNNSNDVDYYYVDLKSSKKITASPYCTGNDNGANMHLKMRIFKKQGEELVAVSFPDALTSSTTLDKGKYFVGVETRSNSNQTRYGMLGNYQIRID